jgi:hypothetical protein
MSPLSLSCCFFLYSKSGIRAVEVSNENIEWPRKVEESYDLPYIKGQTLCLSSERRIRRPFA